MSVADLRDVVTLTGSKEARKEWLIRVPVLTPQRNQPLPVAESQPARSGRDRKPARKPFQRGPGYGGNRRQSPPQRRRNDHVAT